MSREHEPFVIAGVACVIIVFFVAAFIRDPRKRFFVGLLLCIAAVIGTWVLDAEVSRSDAAKRADNPRIYAENRELLDAGIEPPLDGAKREELIRQLRARSATPLPVARTTPNHATYAPPVYRRPATPSPAEISAEIERKYGNPK